MNSPDTSRVVETFIPLTTPPAETTIHYWLQYIDTLRTKVSPLFKNLQAARLIAWYSFLCHNRKSGVPTTPDDNRYYVHIRVEMASGVQENDLRKALPDFCKMTQMMPGPHPHVISGLDSSFFKDSDITQGWRVLGESSQWVLSMLEAHDSGRDMPLQHLSQFLHYIGNQLMVKWVSVPMP